MLNCVKVLNKRVRKLSSHPDLGRLRFSEGGLFILGAYQATGMLAIRSFRRVSNRLDFNYQLLILVSLNIMSEKPLWSYCAGCRQKTKHSALFKKSVEDEDEYMVFGKGIYYVLECNGCEEISFRRDYHNYLESYEDEQGKEIYKVEIKIYPSQLENHEMLDSFYFLPEKIKNIYEQTILALKGESKLLAGAGFRAVIEAICIEEKIKGGNLEQKINNLAKNRLITEKEAERLHTIRFLGNDSIHEIEIPSDKKLYLVLNIIEHLLKNIYILDENANGLLDTIIKEYRQFEALVIKCIMEKFKTGDIKTLKEILGKHVRRISTDLNIYEKALLENIQNEHIEWLTIESTSGDEAQYKITRKIVDFDLPF
jgi:hypothetical protein